MTRAIASLLAYQATIAPSPGPITCAFPWSSTRQTVSSADDHLTQRVTSSDAAAGVTCADQDLLAVTDVLERPGRQDLELSTRGSPSLGGAAPWLIHSLKMRYSSELVPNRTPPLWAIAPEGFARNRLRPGSASSTRRPRSCLTMLKKSVAGS